MWTQDAGRRTQDAGRRTQDAGRRTQIKPGHLIQIVKIRIGISPVFCVLFSACWPEGP